MARKHRKTKACICLLAQPTFTSSALPSPLCFYGRCGNPLPHEGSTGPTIAWIFPQRVKVQQCLYVLWNQRRATAAWVTTVLWLLVSQSLISSRTPICAGIWYQDHPSGFAINPWLRILFGASHSGPGKIGQAMQIDLALDGINLITSEVLSCFLLLLCGTRQHYSIWLNSWNQQELWIEEGTHQIAEKDIQATPRINIDYAGEWKDKPLRFYIKNNVHVSKPAFSTSRNK